MSNTLDEQLISQKIHNYNYAPGIATYGVDGKTGDTGVSGNNIFYTNLNIKNVEDFNTIKERIKEKQLPLKNAQIQITRGYINGDYFFDNNGIIWKLKNKDEFGDTYVSNFSVVGTINITDDDYVTYSDDRLIINSSTYNGFDIVSSNDVSANINKNAALNIVSDSIDENNRVQLLQLNSINTNSIEDGTTQIYYDNDDNAFHLNSNVPIVIDADVKINNDAVNKEYDNYSTVLTSHDTITYFKSLCDKLTYNITTGNDNQNYMLIYAKDYETEDASGATILKELINKNVYSKVYGKSGQQTFVQLESYDSNNGNLSIIPDASLAVCTDYVPDVSKYYNINPPEDHGNSYNIDISFNVISDDNNYFTTYNSSGSEEHWIYRGKRNLTYYGKERYEDASSKLITKENAYVYSSSEGNGNLAVFNPMLLIPDDNSIYNVSYYKDYVYYNGYWNSGAVVSDNSSTTIDLTKRMVSYPAHVINQRAYVILGTGTYQCKFKEPDLTNIKYISDHGYIDLNTQIYTKSGDYTYKFTYIEPEEIDEIYTDASFGPYKHSWSTDFFKIVVCSPLLNKTSENWISQRVYNLHYVKAHTDEFKGKTEKDYPKFIDGEEYEFKFSLYIGDDGLRITNATLSGKLENNIVNENIPAVKVQIPDYIGDTAKVSLVYNTEVFLS